MEDSSGFHGQMLTAGSSPVQSRGASEGVVHCETARCAGHNRQMHRVIAYNAARISPSIPPPRSRSRTSVRIPGSARSASSFMRMPALPAARQKASAPRARSLRFPYLGAHTPKAAVVSTSPCWSRSFPSWSSSLLRQGAQILLANNPSRAPSKDSHRKNAVEPQSRSPSPPRTGPSRGTGPKTESHV